MRELVTHTAVINRNADGDSPYGNDVGSPTNARWRMRGRDYIIVINRDYVNSNRTLRSIVNPNATWMLFFEQSGSSVWSTGDELTLKYVNPIQAGIDEYRFQVPTEVEVIGAPESFLLSQNYPNPFNPETKIDYSLPEQSDVKLLIYNLLGQEVFRFDIAGQKAGEHQIVWNGKNSRGNELASGLYIYKFSAGDFVQTKKMLLLK